MAISEGPYNEEMVREFYISYVAALWGPSNRLANPANQVLLTYVLVRGRQVDISSPSIHRFLYGEATDAGRVPLTAEFDYKWKVVKTG